MSALSYEFVLRHDCDPPHCSNLPREERLRRVDWVAWSPGYAIEQGESGPPKGVLLGDWNGWSGRATDLLERAGYAVEWEDEWTTCSGCGKALRTSPDSYSWQSAYIEADDGIYCFECADIAGYLESMEDKPHRCCFAWIDPGEYGYERMSEEGQYESGFHPGQDDKPEDVLRELHGRGVRGVVFRVSDTGQFDINFETWRRVQEDGDDKETSSE